MFANWVEMTSSTGGTGTLTLAAVAGYPTFQNVFGASGIWPIGYNIREWAGTDRSLPPILAEAGYGLLDLATGVLTRTKRTSTWNAATYDATNPAALSFGTTAANIRVTSSPLAEYGPEIIPFMAVATPASDIGIGSGHAQITTSTRTISANTGYFMAFEWLGCGEILTATIYCSTQIAASGCKLALFDVGANGYPGNRLIDFTGGTPLVTTAIGIKTATLATPIYLPPDWYYVAMVSGHAIGVRAMSPQSQLSVTGCANIGGPNTSINVAVTYTTGFAATAPTSGWSNGGTQNGPAIFIKSRN